MALGQSTQSVYAVQSLEALDWVVLVAYFSLLAGAGWWWARKAAKSEADYFFASRSMPAWVVAISLIATAQSAATFLGVPSAAYSGSFSYILGNASYIVGGIIASVLFLRQYHALGVRSPYEFIEQHAGRPAKLACVWMFVIGKLLGAGARTYIGAIPLSLALFGTTEFGPLSLCIVAIMIVAVLFTLVGGVRSVIWTDMLQVAVYMGAAIAAIFVLLHAIDMPLGSIVQTLEQASTEGTGKVSKLTLFDTGYSGGSFAWSNAFTLPAAFTGAMLLCIAVLVSDQDAVQRALSCKSPREAVRSTVLAQVLGVPVVLVFLTIGMLLFVYHHKLAGIAAAGGTAMPAAKDVFQNFIFSDQMPAGLRGLMIAGVLAIGPIGINATLNSLASIVSSDLLPARAGEHAATASAASSRDGGAARARNLVLLVAGALLAVSIGAAMWHKISNVPLIDFALNSLSFSFAPLLAVIVSLVLLRRGSTLSIIAALACGFGTCVLLQKPVLAAIEGVLQAPSASATASIVSWASSLAFPYHFVLACAVSLLVCVLGKPARSAGSSVRGQLAQLAKGHA